MAKEELDRVSINASEAAVNVKQQDIALLLKKKDADDQQANKTEAEAPVDQAAVVETQDEALMVASADSVFASDGAYMVAAADGAGGAGGSEGLSTGTLLAIGGVALVGGGIAIAASDDSGNGNKSVPTAASASSAAVDEGQTATFNVTGTPGATLTYVLSGVQAADVVGGVLTGTVVLDANGNGVVAVTLVEDHLTEGAETLTLTVDGATAQVTVNDTSLNLPIDLTQQVDNFVPGNGATDGNDLYTGVTAFGGVGILGDTVNPGDSIDAGGGIDELRILLAGPTNTISNLTTNNLERLTLNLNSQSSDGSNYVDAVSLNGLQDIAVNLLAPDASGSLEFDNLSGAVNSITVDGADTNAAHSSTFELEVTAGSQPLTIGGITIKDLNGDDGSSDDILNVYGVSNIPTLSFSNVANDGETTNSTTLNANVTVLGSVTASALTVHLDSVGSVSNDSVLNIAIDSTSTTDVITDLELNLDGGTENAVLFSNTGILDSVVVKGSGDGVIGFTDTTQISSFNASAATGDLATGLFTTVDVTASMGSGNDFLGLFTAGDAIVSMGAGNDALFASVTGDLTATLGDGNDATVVNVGGDLDVDGGAGDDLVVIAPGGIDSLDVAVGGAGFDTLAIDSADFTATNLTGVSGFENLLAVGNNAPSAYDLSALSGLTTVTVGGVIADQGPDFLLAGPTFFPLSDATAEYRFQNASADVDTMVLNFSNSNATGIRFNRLVDNAANSLTLEIGNNADETAANNLLDAMTITRLRLNDEEALTINSTGYTDADATADLNTITTLNVNDLLALTITGDKDLTLTDISTAGLLTKIDASAFTGDLTISGVSGAGTTSIQFIGGTGVDTYTGTANGDTVNGGAGNDIITLGAAGNEDTIILEAGDALIDGADVETYSNFIVTEDTIDLGAFGFTGSQASAIGNQNGAWADFDGGLVDDTTVIADFFADAGVDRGVMLVTDGANGTYVVIDANKDGNFQGDTDLVVFLDSAAAVVTHSDFGF